MKSFTFNLLPEKPKEQVVKEETRDRSSLYTAILPLLGVLIWLGLTLFNSLVVGRVKANWQSSVDQKKQRIKTEFQSVLVAHGEYVKKTQALSEPVQKDIKPEQVFLLADKMFPTPEEGVKINSYDRAKDGSFSIGLVTDNLRKLAEVVRRFNSVKNITLVRLSSVSYTEDNNDYTSVINFIIIEQFEEATVTVVPTEIPQ